MLNGADIAKLAWVHKYGKEIIAAFEEALEAGEQRQAFVIKATVDALHAQIFRIHSNAIEPLDGGGDA